MSILKKSRILSVDDVEDNLTLVRTLLEDEGNMHRPFGSRRDGSLCCRGTAVTESAECAVAPYCLPSGVQHPRLVSE